jgi:hypothetical protein
MPAIHCLRGVPSVAALLLATSAWASDDREWDFTVSLGSRPMGTHRFTLHSPGTGGHALLSDARFDEATRCARMRPAAP